MTRLRAEIGRILPENSFVRIDRTGRALYAVAADDETVSALRLAGWLCEPAGKIWLIAPGLDHLNRMREGAPHHPQCDIFAHRPADPSILPLFAALLRALELPPTPSALNKLDKQLRQSAAIALRTGSGGGLELCRSLFTQIKPT